MGFWLLDIREVRRSLINIIFGNNRGIGLNISIQKVKVVDYLDTLALTEYTDNR